MRILRTAGEILPILHALIHKPGDNGFEIN